MLRGHEGNRLNFAIAERGTEKVVHAVRAIIMANWNNPDFVFTNINITNAFNTKNRTTVLKAVGKYAPGIYKMSVLQYYDDVTLYMVDCDAMQSKTGQQQGDTFGNLRWACDDKYLCEHEPELRRIAKLFNVAFMGDGYVAGATRDVSAFFVATRRIFGEHDSHYNAPARIATWRRR